MSKLAVCLQSSGLEPLDDSIYSLPDIILFVPALWLRNAYVVISLLQLQKGFSFLSPERLRYLMPNLAGSVLRYC